MVSSSSCAQCQTTTYFWDFLSAFSHPWFTPGVTHVKLDVHQCRHWKLAAWQCPAASPQWREGGTDRSPKGVKLIVGEFTNNGAIKMEKIRIFVQRHFAMFYTHISKLWSNMINYTWNYTWLIFRDGLRLRPSSERKAKNHKVDCLKSRTNKRLVLCTHMSLVIQFWAEFPQFHLELQWLRPSQLKQIGGCCAISLCRTPYAGQELYQRHGRIGFELTLYSESLLAVWVDTGLLDILWHRWHQNQGDEIPA